MQASMAKEYLRKDQRSQDVVMQQEARSTCAHSTGSGASHHQLRLTCAAR